MSIIKNHVKKPEKATKKASEKTLKSSQRLILFQVAL